MPRPRTDSHWAQRLATLVEDDERLRPPAIFKLLEAEARQAHPPRTDYPSERTIRRLYEEYKKLDPRVRLEQGRLHWPRSFATGALPWESSRAALDLLRFRDQNGMSHPTTRQAKWFWRLRLASPSIPIADASSISFTLAMIDWLTVTGSPPHTTGGLEWQLAYEPWGGLDEKAAFDRACAKHPDRAEALGFRFTGSADELNAQSATVQSYVADLHAPGGETSNG